MAKFEKGHKGAKPKGAVNKINKLVKDVVSDVFTKLQEDPTAKQAKADMYTWATENPKDFYNIAAKLIPVQMEHEGSFSLVWEEQKTYEAKQETNSGS